MILDAGGLVIVEAQRLACPLKKAVVGKPCAVHRVFDRRSQFLADGPDDASSLAMVETYRLGRLFGNRFREIGAGVFGDVPRALPADDLFLGLGL
ncbi:hypothetical protein DDZ14_15110 [Maritimibacter sp. 55A14]|nr:hypothetical protein DDZ14_15110 [Maritimibacter sp. 55A14]